MSEPLTPSFGHCDLLPSAMIFGGLLIALTAVGGAMEGTSAQWVDEIKVVAGENLVGSDDMDPLASCKTTEKNGAFGDLAKHCRENQIVKARVPHRRQ